MVIKKEKYDRYDLFYYTNHMFKFMLNKYDSHTKMLFLDNKYLPIKIRFFDGKPYIVDSVKNIGARIIGTDPGTTISCFGNCVMQQKLENMNLKVMGSATYWYYDENLQCHGIYKENFEAAIKRFPHLFDLVYFNVDDKVELTLEDYLNGDDSVLEYALSCFDK